LKDKRIFVGKFNNLIVKDFKNVVYPNPVLKIRVANNNACCVAVNEMPKNLKIFNVGTFQFFIAPPKNPILIQGHWTEIFRYIPLKGITFILYTVYLAV